MVYPLLKLYARLAFKIYVRQIKINQPEYLKKKGPLLLAANHPNSFLDGIILTTLFNNTIYSLARGDAFKNQHINRFLRWLRLLPVYRTSEGVENLGQNYTTFNSCQKTFARGDIVLIFSEGRCENEWHLRPLKKGTARLAITAWQNSMPLEVLPVAFNYSTFKKFGKTVHLNFGQIITAADINQQDLTSKQLLQFNNNLQQQLQHLVYEIDDKDTATVRKTFKRAKSTLFYALLFLPAIAGWLLHAPLYFPVKAFTHFRFKNSGHYDSVLHSLLLLAYPLYVLALVIILSKAHIALGLLMLLILPFTAWAWVQWSEVLE